MRTATEGESAQVVVDGGIAGFEALLRLRRLAGDALDVTQLDARRHCVSAG